MATTAPQWQQIRSSQQQVTVTVDTGLGHVTIADREDPENDVFLQGDDGYSFIDRAKSLWDKNGDLSMEDAYHFHAYDYLDLLYHA